MQIGSINFILNKIILNIIIFANYMNEWNARGFERMAGNRLVFNGLLDAVPEVTT